MKLPLPDHSLVLLIGPAGCGKSTFARKHFRPTEVVSSDACRGMVADDEADQTASKDAFELLHRIVAMRLRRGRLTVVDATNVRARERKELLALARAHRRPAVAIVFDLPPRTCQERNLRRVDRVAPREVVRVQHRRMRLSLPRLKAEGFAKVLVFCSAKDVDAATVGRR